MNDTEAPVRRSSSQTRSSSPSVQSESSAVARPRKETIHLTPQYAPKLYSSRQDSFHPYGSFHSSWAGEDPRSSSMHSLRPTESTRDGKRTLLVIYIHGFLGDETTFRSFPAHVHNLVTMSLADTHRVHTKIYPKYKSRRDMSYAVDDFSNWLFPHENPTTDIILAGHSLGGILAAEVALLKSHLPHSNEMRQHRILGVMAFDTPFLGMHPSVVRTGIASLFRTAPAPPQAAPPEARESDLSHVSTASSYNSSSSNPNDVFRVPMDDPQYNPSFLNDVIRPHRSKLENTWYFWNKHYGEMAKATTAYVTSHFEFGGCLADYQGLKRRYQAIRALEDVNELSRVRDASGKLVRRVRFVNYYSASTGRVKEGQVNDPNKNIEMQEINQRSTDTSATSLNSSCMSPSHRLSLEEHVDGEVLQKDLRDFELDRSEISTDDLPRRMSSDELTPRLQSKSGESLGVLPSYPSESLPPIPQLPNPPADFDPSLYSAKDILKLAKKAHEREVKAYERAKKDRAKSIKEREKMIIKRKKIAERQQVKDQKATQKQRVIEQDEELKRDTTLNPEAYEKQIEQDKIMEERTGKPRKKQKDRKFCLLPPKDPRTAMRDSTWIRVYMEGVDEVTAHTSLFFMSETYAKLVGDAAERIREWVEEDMSKNLVLAEG